MPDRFSFYSGSADVRPGAGPQESIGSTAYPLLSRTPNWRRILSNFHEAPFTWQNRTFNTVEHAFQGYKFELFYPGTLDRFTTAATGSLAIGPRGLDARRARKLYILNGAQLNVWERGTTPSIKRTVMRQIRTAKYQQCEVARHILLATGEAELWHVVPRSQQLHELDLEDLRGQLRAAP